MKKTAFALLLAAALVGCKSDDWRSGKNNKQVQPTQTAQAPAADVKYASFGEPMKMSNEAPVPVATVLAHLDQYKDQYVRVTGNVAAVCEKKGCWLKMADEQGNDLFVKFTCPVNGRLVPLEAKGKPVIAEGTLKVKEVSEAEARHLAEDSGKSQDEINKIVGPQKQVSLMAPSAKVAGL
jgi:hypothetical protein